MKEFDKIIGYEEEKRELERLADIMRNTEKYRNLGVETPRGVLIEGDPGLGKSLMATALIEASGRKAFVCRKDKPDGDFVQVIKQVFDDAKAAAPSTVLLDDLDKFSNQDMHHRNSDAFVTIQSCIDDCRGTEVFVIATANETDCIPESLLRAGRFDKILDIKPPKYEDALKIVEFYLSTKKFVADVDIQLITRIMDGRSCAELETVINEAGIYAGYAGKTCIEMEDMVKACLRVIFRAPEIVKSDNDFLDEVAYHECGHVVINEILEPGSVNLVSVAPYNGEIGGVTSFFRNKNYFKSKKYMETRVMAILGGRAATEIVFGKTDVGSHSDLNRAYMISERFIDDYCSSGFGMFERGNNGPDLLNRKDMAIELEMTRAYNESKRILIENRDFLDALARELMEKKTLLRSDIARIKERCKKVA